MKSGDIQIRRDICRACKLKCEDYLAGAIDHGDPCVGCERRIWHAYGLCESHASTSGEESGVAALTVAAQPAAAAAPAVNATWAELHQRALAFTGPEDAAWLLAFTRRVKCGGCRKNWRAWLASNPPEWGDYFGWTVAAHNDVNQRLGKPLLTLTEAAAIWSAA